MDTSTSESPASTDAVFVFGSNLAGRHGKGAALYARQRRGAIYGQGEGLLGLQGRSYAIPTKDAMIRTLPLAAIASHVARFAAGGRGAGAWSLRCDAGQGALQGRRRARVLMWARPR